jgi:hypothetical protein
MTLSEVREGLPFQLISKHVKSHQDKERAFADLTRPEQLNVLADHGATAALDLRAADEIKELYPLPACRAYLRDRNGYIVAKYARSETNSLSTSFELTFKNAMTGQTGSTSPSVGLLTDQPLPDLLTGARTFVVKLTHGWLPRRSRATM